MVDSRYYEIKVEGSQSNDNLKKRITYKLEKLMSDTIDASKIKTDFGENDEIKDEYLMELFGKAYKGEIMCQMANIRMEVIEPSTKYRPEASEEFRNNFLKKAKEGKSIPMFVYQKDGKFMMSDDYNSYYMYKELNASIVPCVIIGDVADMKYVVNIGKPFQLEAPKFEVIN